MRLEPQHASVCQQVSSRRAPAQLRSFPRRADGLPTASRGAPHGPASGSVARAADEVGRAVAHEGMAWFVLRMRNSAGMRRTLIAVVGLIGLALVFQASAALRPPFLTQAIPVYGVELPDDKVWTYNGDYVMAVFDYDRVNGNPNIKSLPYTVCSVVPAKRTCVKRTWRGRPDVWMFRVLGPLGAGRYFELKWTALGKPRGTVRVWVYE